MKDNKVFWYQAPLLLALVISTLLHIGLILIIYKASNFWLNSDPGQLNAVQQSISLSIVSQVQDPNHQRLESIKDTNVKLNTPTIQEKPKISTTKSIQTTVPTKLSPKQPKVKRLQNNTPPSNKQSPSQQTLLPITNKYVIADYHSNLRTWLENHKVYPRQARLAGIEGVVKVEFMIKRDGQLVVKKIVQSSGHAILDKAVLDTLEKAAPFPAFPSSIPDSSMLISISINFFLT